MTSETLKLYKLIILYFLNETRQPMSNAIISDFILGNGYTDYFSIQETLTGLIEDKNIEAEQTHSTSYYTITDIGKETLEYFGTQLSDSIKEQIDDYLIKNRVAIAQSTNIHTDFTHIGNGEYIAKCSVMERGNLLYEVSINVPSEAEAIRVCETLKAKNEEIYTFLIKEISQ